MDLKYNLLLGCSVLLLLTGCAPEMGSEPSSSSEQPSSSSIASEPLEEKTLLIGKNGLQKEYEYTGIADPQEVIEAIASLTGWNLELAAQPEVENNQVKIAFAQGASIFTGPPEHQKEEFHVFDAQDLVFTILDSVSSSLMEICGYDGVYFIADDGGDLAFENGGFSFVFPAGNLYEGSENGEQYLIF